MRAATILLCLMLLGCQRKPYWIEPGKYRVKGSEAKLKVKAWKGPTTSQSLMSGDHYVRTYFLDERGWPSALSFFDEYQWGYDYELETLNELTIFKDVADAPPVSLNTLVVKVTSKKPVDKGSCFSFQLKNGYHEVKSKLRVEEFIDLFRPNPVEFAEPALQKKLENQLKGKLFSVKLCFQHMPDPKITVVAVEGG